MIQSGMTMRQSLLTHVFCKKSLTPPYETQAFAYTTHMTQLILVGYFPAPFYPRAILVVAGIQGCKDLPGFLIRDVEAILQDRAQLVQLDSALLVLVQFLS